MRSIWKRLTVAFLLSLSGIAGTLYWYKNTAPAYSEASLSPIAQVGRIGNEVLKRPPTRLLWRALSRGDNLFSGEEIRTSAQGELRIQFEDGRFIDMEPDSLIVLQQIQGEIAMDLLEGSLFVNANGSPAAVDKLTLKSKTGKVNLTGSSANLAKNEEDTVDVQVTEGKINVQDETGKTQELVAGKSSRLTAKGLEHEQPRWESILPAHSGPFFADPDQPAKIEFTWKNADPRWLIELRVGATRNEMRNLSGAEAGMTSISQSIPFGKHWWKLVALDPNTHALVAQTKMKRIEIVAGFPPTTVSPLPQARITGQDSTAEVRFHWQKPEAALQTQLQVFAADRMESPVLNKTFHDEESFVIPSLPDGKYLWRMSATYSGVELPFTGAFNHFSIGELSPAEIIWDNPDLTDAPFVNQVNLNLAWQIKTRKNEIEKLSLVVKDESAEGRPKKLNLTGNDSTAVINIKKSGRYTASLEGYDKSGNLIGASAPKIVNLNEIPLLVAPTFREPENLDWISSPGGDLDITWDPLSDAATYQLSVVRANGSVVFQRSTKEPTLALKSVLPGNYVIKLNGVDQYGRSGAPATAKLKVPSLSNIRAPTLKRAKIE